MTYYLTNNRGFRLESGDGSKKAVRKLGRQYAQAGTVVMVFIDYGNDLVRYSAADTAYANKSVKPRLTGGA